MQPLIKGLDLFRTQTGNREQFQNGLRELRTQILEVFQRASTSKLFDFEGNAFSNPRNFRDCFFVLQIRNIAAKGFYCARCVSVSSNLERIFALQFSSVAICSKMRAISSLVIA